MASNARAQNIITPEFRGSFVHLFEREKKVDGSEGNFSLLLLCPKTSDNWMTDLSWLWANISECLQTQFPGGAGAPPAFAQYGLGKPWPVSDGDAPNSMGNVQEAHKGHWVVRVSSGNFNPDVNLMNEQTSELGTLNASTCFSGCFFKVQLNAYYWARPDGVGIGLGMNNVLLTKTGESLGGGGQDAATAFGITPVASSAAAAFQPGAPGPAATPAPAPAAAPAPGLPAAPAVGAAPAMPVAPAAAGAAAPTADWLK